MARKLSEQFDEMRTQIMPMQSFVASLCDHNPDDAEVKDALDKLYQARVALERLMMRAGREGR